MSSLTILENNFLRKRQEQGDRARNKKACSTESPFNCLEGVPLKKTKLAACVIAGLLGECVAKNIFGGIPGSLIAGPILATLGGGATGHVVFRKDDLSTPHLGGGIYGLLGVPAEFARSAVWHCVAPHVMPHVTNALSTVAPKVLQLICG